MTGGRVKKGVEYKNDEKNFFLTYGDALSTANLGELENFHNENKPIVTVTAVRPPARFGSLEIKNHIVEKFGEKDQAKEGWINGGFFVVENEIINFIDDEKTIFEKYPLEEVSRIKKLLAFNHTGFWQCADTIRELEILESAMIENNYTKKFNLL